MRELKFRAWNGRNFGYFDLREDSDYEFYDFYEDQNVDSPIEQYTGLKDKNGKEIYEGDILREKGLLSLTYVDWDKNHARYQTKVIDKSKHVSSIFDFDIIDALECEVIGNIHENPELLEAKEE